MANLAAQLTNAYSAASQKTASDLRTIASSPKIAQLSRLTLPEIEALTEQIAQVVPAGNVPGLILSGLTRIEGRKVPLGEQQRHLGVLFRGVRDVLDKAVYGTMFAGPAAIILGYQKLLQLAGKDVESAFPEGTWQFYLNFALREDSARHANETTGFRGMLTAHKIGLSEVDALSAWIMAAVITLQTYDRLLENEWRERTYTAILRQVADPGVVDEATTSRLHAAYAEWERQRPFMRGHDAGNQDYAAYRRSKFDTFLRQLLVLLPTSAQAAFDEGSAAVEHEALPAYLRQMSILARLEPGQYQENRAAYALEEANVAIVYQGQYTLLPIYESQRQAWADVDSIRRFVASLFNEPTPDQPAEVDLLLARSSRASQINLRESSQEAHEVAKVLSCSPIIINWDHVRARLPLAEVRQGHRGIGDHALTLFFTEDSTIFDQSHIFFDGAWGSALAEIMTNEALSWALYLAQLPPAVPGKSKPARLAMAAQSKLRDAAERARLPIEASAENTSIRLAPVLALRRLFKTRNDLVNVTVNDLLILYRSIHGQRYVPGSTLQGQMEVLAADNRPESRKAYNAIEEALERVRRNNPAILIPMDASQHSPRERLFPTTFRNPMSDLLNFHEATLTALNEYKSAVRDRKAVYAAFDERQRQYLRMIGGFGELMRRYKDIALSGQSTSTMSIKMLAHMPDAVQRLLDQIPGQFDVLNEIIKGEEVFSNVGRVAKGSTLRRFITAKDDNLQKTLAWGVLTDDQDVVHISLRDFRPHVTLLHDCRLGALADLIVRDFLDGYVDGFNIFIRELRDITVASRETRTHLEGGERQ